MSVALPVLLIFFAGRVVGWFSRSSYEADRR